MLCEIFDERVHVRCVRHAINIRFGRHKNLEVNFQEEEKKKRTTHFGCENIFDTFGRLWFVSQSNESVSVWQNHQFIYTSVEPFYLFWECVPYKEFSVYSYPSHSSALFSLFFSISHSSLFDLFFKDPKWMEESRAGKIIWFLIRFALTFFQHLECTFANRIIKSVNTHRIKMMILPVWQMNNILKATMNRSPHWMSIFTWMIQEREKNETCSSIHQNLLTTCFPNIRYFDFEWVVTCSGQHSCLSTRQKKSFLALLITKLIQVFGDLGSLFQSSGKFCHWMTRMQCSVRCLSTEYRPSMQTSVQVVWKWLWKQKAGEKNRMFSAKVLHVVYLHVQN